MPKNTKNTKKPPKIDTNFDLTTDSSTEKNSKNEASTKSDTVWQDIIQSDIIFYPQILKYFNDSCNRNFST